jgi:transcription initiation factor IIE alpha subunit
MLVRYRTIGATDDDVMPWPITQDELADATGMTSVHINRTLRQLREDGLIEVNRREMTVLDPDRLRQLSGFNPNYLHLIRTREGHGKVAKRAGDLV